MPTDSAERSERKLVRAAQRGSKEAFGELFRMHWPRVHRASYLIVQDSAAAEDIAQEAFMAALRHLDDSTLAGHSGHGCIRSSSTARSTGPGRTGSHRGAFRPWIEGEGEPGSAPGRPAVSDELMAALAASR